MPVKAILIFIAFGLLIPQAATAGSSGSCQPQSESCAGWLSAPLKQRRDGNPPSPGNLASKSSTPDYGPVKAARPWPVWPPQARTSSRRSLLAEPTRCPGQQLDPLERRLEATAAMLCLTNYARANSGRSPYRLSAVLTRSAILKANDIIRCNNFSHNACQRPFVWWIQKGYIAGERCWRAGENIAWGDRGLGTPQEIFKAWMASPAHRAAILSAEYREIGIGFRSGALGPVSEARVWVQHFGRIC